MSGQINFTQVDSPTAPSTGITALSFPATSLNQLKFVDGDGATNIIAFPTAGGTLTVPTGGGTVVLTSNNLSVLAATTSAQLAGVISDETGSGALVFATSPTLTTPSLGVATATTINKVTLTQPATGSTLTIADGKTLTASNSLTLAGTDGKSLTLTGSLTVPADGTAALLGTSNTFSASQTISSAGYVDFSVNQTDSSKITIGALSGGPNSFINVQGQGAFAGLGILRFLIEGNAYGYIFNNGHFAIGTSTDSAQLTVLAGSTSTAGLVVDTPASPTANIAEFRNNGTAVGGFGPNGSLFIKDGMTAPGAASGFARIYVDSADGDLKVVFGDGTVKTIVVDS